MANIIAFPTKPAPMQTPVDYDFTGEWQRIVNDPTISKPMLDDILDNQYDIMEISKSYSIARYAKTDLRSAEVLRRAMDSILNEQRLYISLKEIQDFARGYLWTKDNYTICHAWAFTTFNLGSIMDTAPYRFIIT